MCNVVGLPAGTHADASRPSGQHCGRHDYPAGVYS